jgi:acyl-CoA thioesterase-1
MSMKILMMIGFVGAAAACSPGRNMEKVPSQPGDSRASGRPAETRGKNDAYGSVRAPDSSRAKVTVLFFGTSLTAGYGLADTKHAFPNLISQKAAATGTPIVAINAGLSGETSAGAVRRIDWTLKRPVDIVVVETGGNDALRALDPDTLKDNLEQIVGRIRSTQPKARILLVEMLAPPNLGRAYTAKFRGAYADVSRRYSLTLVPFLLDKVAGRPELNQPDGVHPNDRGEAIVADNVWRALEPVVREVYGAAAKG